jgi:radical SAM superfamily enzyme YgiQ (UPF0313 family)
LGYVASALVDDGHDVRIYDAEWGPDFPEKMQIPDHPLTDMALNWHRYFDALEDPRHEIWQEVESVVRKHQPEAIGITCRVLDLASALRIARIARSVNDRIIVVLGGPATSTCTDAIFQDENVDFAVRGEGEITAVELLRAVQQPAPPLEEVAGLSFRGPGGMVHNPDRPLITDIDALPYPARDLLLHTDQVPQRKLQHMMGEMVSSRGCPYRCTFCAVKAVWGSPRVRVRQPEDVVAEVIHQRDTYGARFITFWDDLFTTTRRRTAAICNLLIEHQVKLPWLCLVRADTVDHELLSLMKRAGCVQVQMGVESGSDRILDKMRKGVTVEQIKSAAAVIREAGIPLHAFLLIGVPTETREEMDATLRLIPEIEPEYVELSVFAPYPGSPLSDELLEAGRLSERDWLTADFLNVDRCHTGTMSASEFRAYALDCLKVCDDYNASKSGRSPRSTSACVAEAAVAP